MTVSDFAIIVIDENIDCSNTRVAQHNWENVSSKPKKIEGKDLTD